MGAWRSASEGSLMKMPDMSDRPGQKGSERKEGCMLLAQKSHESMGALEHKRESPVSNSGCIRQSIPPWG
ncbi:hypothetical protein SRHO_G00287080 [Serrasalmus rhombeus]